MIICINTTAKDGSTSTVKQSIPLGVHQQVCYINTYSWRNREM